MVPSFLSPWTMRLSDNETFHYPLCISLFQFSCEPSASCQEPTVSCQDLQWLPLTQSPERRPRSFLAALIVLSYPLPPGARISSVLHGYPQAFSIFNPHLPLGDISSNTEAWNVIYVLKVPRCIFLAQTLSCMPRLNSQQTCLASLVECSTGSSLYWVS